MSRAVTSQPTVFSVSRPAHWPQRWFFQQMSHSWSISVSLFCTWFCRYKAVPHFQMMQSWTASVCSILCEWKWGLLIWIVGPIFPEGLAVTKTCLSFCELPLLPGSLGTLLTSQHGFVGNKKVQGFEECWAAMGFECDGNAYKEHKLFREKTKIKICVQDPSAAKPEIQVYLWLLVFCPAFTCLEVLWGEDVRRRAPLLAQRGIAVSSSRSTDWDLLHTHSAKTLTFLLVPHGDVSLSEGELHLIRASCESNFLCC